MMNHNSPPPVDGTITNLRQGGLQDALGLPPNLIVDIAAALSPRLRAAYLDGIAELLGRHHSKIYPLGGGSARKVSMCECADPDCPVCSGSCARSAAMTLYRLDQVDETGTPFCEACAEDALGTDLFAEREDETKE